MRAGKLNRIVQVQRATVTRGALGSVETWADHGDPFRAEKMDLSDAERWRAGEVAAHVTARFRVRWWTFTAGITPKDRLVCEGVTYEITGIKEVERRRELEITVAARTDQ